MCPVVIVIVSLTAGVLCTESIPVLSLVHLPLLFRVYNIFLCGHCLTTDVLCNIYPCVVILSLTTAVLCYYFTDDLCKIYHCVVILSLTDVVLCHF